KSVVMESEVVDENHGMVSRLVFADKE
ncbi:MAG: hypothetical protein JWL61_1053, partial [Gemmatimonadetes bacterium]|nr:hypothetical protein [Gemmatimonadota bacterium]